jgi:O-acetyl-ADP-ribose deacetylase (regulator of RNase III)
MGQDLQTSAALIQRATRNALAAAESLGAATVAFPAFGTGVGGFPLEACARLMIDVVRNQAASARSVRLVRLVLFGQQAFRAFEEAAVGLLGDPVR